jgi:hypothetical protein
MKGKITGKERKRGFDVEPECRIVLESTELRARKRELL